MSRPPLTPAADRPIPFEDRARDRTEFTTCYMCVCRCGIQVTIQDGNVRLAEQ